MTSRGTQRRRHIETALLATGAVVACLLVMWAAAIGPSSTLRGDGNPDDSATRTFQPGQQPTGEEEAQPATPQEPWSSSPWVDAITMVVGVALLVAFLFWAVGVTREHRRTARERRIPADDDLLVRALDATTVTDHADAQFATLREGTPRNAIVALWDELERHIAATGLPREQWETSVEYTQRFLAELQADRDAAERLGALYLEARFSTHELSEQHRHDAEHALESLHASLRSGAR